MKQPILVALLVFVALVVVAVSRTESSSAPAKDVCVGVWLSH